jgi:hypothetical protein
MSPQSIPVSRSPHALQRKCNTILLATIALLLLSGVPLFAVDQDGSAPVVIRGALLGPPVTPYIFDGDVRDLPTPRSWQPGDPIRAIPQRFYQLPWAPLRPSPSPVVDPLLQTEWEKLRAFSVADSAFMSPSRNFVGLEFNGSIPPDTVGDVGPDHYIQMVNDYFSSGGAIARIWDKAEPLPNLLATFGLGELSDGLCASGSGDPVVLYDRQADRWLMTMLDGSLSCVCVYVSMTGDPIAGGWYIYRLGMRSDYQKPAIWATDANGGAGSYIITSNDIDPPIAALNRGAMLNGDRSVTQLFKLPPIPNIIRLHASTPADTDGPSAPPAGEPAIIMRLRDTEVHDQDEVPGDILEMWLLDVDWEDPDNTTLTQAANIDVADFDVTLCDDFAHGWEGCFPQPDTEDVLMALEEVIYHRLQYYRHETHESLVGNFVVDVDGTDHGGLRWFELRRETGGEWALRQEGTYSIDGDHRWMGSIAMDKNGNIALGYSVSSSTTYPSIRYTGRLADDTPGIMTQPEMEILDGAYSQHADGWSRWGDYSAMVLDPSDDCTFWYTNEYLREDGFWITRISSFRFESCGCDETPPPPVLAATVSIPNQIDLFWEDSTTETIVEYLVQRSLVSGGPYETIVVVADASPGIAGGPGYSYDDTDVLADTTYYYSVIASDGGLCKSAPLNEASATATGGSIVIEVVFSEDFEEEDSFDDWSVVNGTEHICGDWKRSDRRTTQPAEESGYSALSDSRDCRGNTFLVDTNLDSPPTLDLSDPEILSVTLKLNFARKCDEGDSATIEVWDGANWQLIATLPNEDSQADLSLDVTPYATGNPDFRLRFHHQTTNKPSWWSVDEVELIAEVAE